MSNDPYLGELKFLVIEDNAFMLSIIRRVLSAFEVNEVRDAGDGAVALEVLESYAADIIIADWEMRPLDGIEFTKMLRRSDDSPNPYLPVIMASGYGEMHRIIEARDAGVNEYVVKPFSVVTLFSRIMAVIDKPRPFIKAKTFFGPDRRRRRNIKIKKERRMDEDMTQADVNELMNRDRKPPEKGMEEGTEEGR